MSTEFICEHCGDDFARRDSLARHKKRRYRCDGDEEDQAVRERKKLNSEVLTIVNKTLPISLDNEIPNFDGAEFCGDKPLTRKTLSKMMKMLKIPEHKWNQIADEELQERNRTKSF